MMLGRTTLASLAGAVGIVLACAGLAGGSESPPTIYLAATQSDRLALEGHDGDGITVAVIDTGVADVPALEGVVVHQENMSAAPAQGDQFGHGTFVAGLVHEAAPGAKIVSVKLSGADGSVDVSQVLAALQWVVLHRDQYSIDVVNLSFGNDSKQSTRTSPLNYAVQRAWDAGIVVVASAGNLGDQPGTVTKPGDDPLIISVGSSADQGTVGIADDDVPAFGSRGPTQDGLAKPDLVAPGTSLVSLRAPGSTIDVENPHARVGVHGFRGSGTSFSAPIVAGAAAQLLASDPTMTPDQVKYALLAGARPIDGDPAAQGSGTLRAVRSWHLLGPVPDNASVQRSSGLGSLDAARGSARVDIVETRQSLLGGVLSLVTAVLGDSSALLDVQGGGLLDLGSPLQPFDREEFLSDDAWDASRWGASRWGSTQWGASRWGASRWGASRWGNSHWWASRWG
jgi:serine protease AprX